MDVAEKFAYKTDQFIPFGLQRATENELYCAASRSKAYVLELIYCHHCDERIFMEQSTMDNLSMFMPSHGVPKNAANIFNRSTKQQQDRLLVDFHLMTEELKIGSERVALSQTRWSPRVNVSHGKYYYLAYLTNFGGCEIRKKHLGKLSWCITVHNIAKEWMMHCQKNMKYAFNTFESFEDAVHTIKITAIAWNNLATDDHILHFCFTTANGMVAFYEVGDMLNLRFQKQLHQKQINVIEWFTLSDDSHNCHRSYVVACETNGMISLLNVIYDRDNDTIADVIETERLFGEADGVHANGIQWEYCSQKNQLIFVICKGMYVFICIFSIDKQTVLSTYLHYVGHLTIHGEQKINN